MNNDAKDLETDLETDLKTDLSPNLKTDLETTLSVLTNPQYLLSLAEHFRLQGNEFEMSKYYRMASEVGNVRAMCLMGDFLLEKEGDTEEAIRFFKIAVDKKNGYACFQVSRYYYQKYTPFPAILNGYFFDIHKDALYAIYYGIEAMRNGLPLSKEYVYELSMLCVNCNYNNHFIEIYKIVFNSYCFKKFNYFYTHVTHHPMQDFCYWCMKKNSSHEKRTLFEYSCKTHSYCSFCYHYLRECPQCFVKKSVEFENILPQNPRGEKCMMCVIC